MAESNQSDVTTQQPISKEQAGRIDRELCAKFKIKRPSYNQEDLDDLKICIEEKLKENQTWKSEWISDDFLIRFLKAFLNVEDTIQAIESYFAWRMEKNVDAIAMLDGATDEELRKEINQDRSVIFENFFDRCGRPISVARIRNHDGNHNNYPSLFKYLIYLQETMMRMADERSHDKRVCIIFDLKGFTLRNMDFKYVKTYLGMVRAYYPERIAQCFIINYPWIFLGCWNIVKLWMNDVSRSKFIFPGKEELNEFMDVDKMPLQLYT